MPKKVEIDKGMFERMCAAQMTAESICEVLDITTKPLRSWCKRTYGLATKDAIRKYRAGGFAKLRMKQYDVAVEEGNVTMLIWLGKIWLGQRDKPEDDRAHTEQVVIKDAIPLQDTEAVYQSADYDPELLEDDAVEVDPVGHDID